MSRLLLYITFAFLTGIAFSQVDTTSKRLDLEHVIIKYLPSPQNVISKVDKRLLNQVNAGDAGELMRYLPGVVLRSYGGLGGLKTIVFRGLSSQDNAIVIDGFERNNLQNGQVNLAQIEADQLVSVMRYDPSHFSIALPVSAAIKGNGILFDTFEEGSIRDTTRLGLTTKYASFNTFEANSSLYLKRKSHGFTAFAKYRSSDGNYPFVYTNGLTEEQGVRTNNAYQDSYLSLGYRLHLKDKRLCFKYRFMQYDQDVPGAIILYVNGANEKMTGFEHRIEVDFLNSYKYRLYTSASLNDLTYNDPDYYSNTSGLTADYRNAEVLVGSMANILHGKKHMLIAGFESKFGQLISNRYFIENPSRSSNIALLTYAFNHHFWQFKGQIGGQFYNDWYRDSASNAWGLNPEITIKRENVYRQIAIAASYKRSLRMPTFNELYYGGIGNVNLLPERADQMNVSLYWIKQIKSRWKLSLNPAIYNNLIRNKINAVPTKNLFVWSMQNIGIAWCYGADMNLQLDFNLNKEEEFVGVKLVYNWMRCVDITDSKSPSYGHQIAYLPEHSLSADLYLILNKWNVRVMNTLLSHRYSLNENIDANLVEGFWVLDLQAGRTLNWKKKHQFTLQLNANNLLNNSYAYIRNYIMPGRNLQITLRYVYN